MLAVYAARMGPKKDYLIPRETEEEHQRLLAGAPVPLRSTGRIIESTHVASDGRVSHATSTMPSAASEERAQPAAVVRAGERAGEGPVYDVLELGVEEVLLMDAGVEAEKEGRALRDSVGPRLLTDMARPLILSQDDPLRQWAEDHLEIFLQEVLRLEGRGDHRSYDICRGCAIGKGEYRCKDCMGGGELLCKECLLKRHAQLPFHRVQVSSLL